MIHIYCGDGKGKTTSAIGLAIRAAGSDKKVLIARFLKNNDSSELKSLAYVPGITVIPIEKDYGFFWNMSEIEKIEAKASYSNYLKKALEMVRKDNVHMLVLDEIIATYNHELINRVEFLDFLKNKPDQLEVVLTGRNPAEELLEIADYVSDIKKIKHPFDKGIGSRIGIEL